MANTFESPTLIEGSLAVDDRGAVSFVNSLSFEGVKRSYIVENFSTETVRAFHGHLKESKYVCVVAGSAIVAAVKMDDPVSPSRSNHVERFVLSARKPAALFIPAGYANGFRALEPGTKIIFFSTASLEESQNDDYRFPADYWGPEVWQVVHR